MKRFVIIEIGSTNTKAYLNEDNEIKDLGFKTIEFKNHYKQNNCLDKEDKEALFNFLDEFKDEQLYVYGTSIFRNLSDEERDSWLKEFKDRTNSEFHIVTSDMENDLTVYGATHNIDYHGSVAVTIGGGGSTELSIIKDNEVIEKANYGFGAMDTTDMFPDLKEDVASTDYDKMVKMTRALITPPKNKADILILAGGDYIYFYESLNYPVKENTFYKSDLQPYSLDVKTMDELDQDFFYNVSLTDVIKRCDNAGWWKGARGMRLCVKALADILEVKYIIPTRITMVYGIAEKIKNNEM